MEAIGSGSSTIAKSPEVSSSKEDDILEYKEKDDKSVSSTYTIYDVTRKAQMSYPCQDTQAPASESVENNKSCKV